MSLQTLVQERLLSCGSELFEDICCELLRGLGFTNVSRRGSHFDRDRGRDIEGHYFRLLPNGRSHVVESWFFECKYLARRVSVGDIQEKINWAVAEKADFLVIISIYGSTSECLDFTRKLELGRSLRIQFWDSQELSRLIAESPSVLINHFADLIGSDEAKKKVDAEERIALARNLLSSVGIMRDDFDARRYSLLREIIGRIIRKQDIHSIAMDDLDDDDSAIVYILGVSGHGVEEERLCALLQAAIKKFPEQEAFWRIAQNVDDRKIRTKRKRGLRRIFFVGPVGSGKSCLIARLLITFASDPQYSLDASSFLDIAAIHRRFRDKYLMPATCLSHDGYQVSMVGEDVDQRDLELIDTTGGVFQDQRWDSIYIGSGATVCLIFDPTGRSVLHQDDPGDTRPCKSALERIELYGKFVEFATRQEWNILPVITKCDLIDPGDLRDCVIPQIAALLRVPREVVVGPSVIIKRADRIVQNSVGITHLINSIIQSAHA